MHETSTTKNITVIPGDGIGPEVVNAALRIIAATGIKINAEIHEAGAKAFQKGIESGVPKDTQESIDRTRVVLKGPLETPLGKGNRSANVTLRKMFETFANVRPVREIPGVRTPYSGRKLDLVVVRENVEDLYAGIEYMQTPGVAECLKIITKPGCEKITRFAFEFARSEQRKRIHCATKSNIMKLTEGMLQRTFEAIAPQYPEIEAKHILVDNCAHQLVMRPEQFDVILTTNMNGDIISDLTSGLTGGLGFAPSANIGSEVAMFEAVHGSAPDIAGRNLANPAALVLSAAMMLRYIGEGKAANDIEQAVLVTFEQGIRTADMAGDTPVCSTTQFTDTVIANLGRQSQTASSRDYKAFRMPASEGTVDYVEATTRHTVGIDVFVESTDMPLQLVDKIESKLGGSPFKLLSVANRGTAVYPPNGTRGSLVDHYRCRFVPGEGSDVKESDIVDLLQRVSAVYTWMHVEKLQQFDGVDVFSKSR